ncbi:MAG: hypothetical protein ABI554_05425 [Flavobacterium sp.]
MSRRGDDGCTIIMTFFSIITAIIYSIVLAFQGHFTPIKVVLVIGAIILALHLLDKFKQWKSKQQISKDEKNSTGSIIVFIFIAAFVVALIKTTKKKDYATDKSISVDYTKPVIKVNENENLPISKEAKKKIVWFFKTFNNTSFELPENLVISNEYSNTHSNIYFDYNSNFSFSISCQMLNDENLNSNIEDLPIDLQTYAETFNENNRHDFDDFILDSYEISELGNKKSIKIQQYSRKVSGIKNVEMKVVNYNVISTPYYYNITYSYPKDSIKYDTIFKKIEKSFIFKDTVK